MTKYHRKAIELKYNGYTHPEIAKALGEKIASTTLDNYFSEGGMLFLPYMQYESRMSHWSLESAKDQYKKIAAWLPKAKLSLLNTAFKTKDYRLAFSIIQDIEDRMGLVAEKAQKGKPTEEELKQLSNKELYERLEKAGLTRVDRNDPGSGASSTN